MKKDQRAQSELFFKKKIVWRACNLTTRLLPVMRDLGSIPRWYLYETGILLLALSCYIGDPDVIDHCGLV
jgi:hypothetical protein